MDVRAWVAAGVIAGCGAFGGGCSTTHHPTATSPRSAGRATGTTVPANGRATAAAFAAADAVPVDVVGTDCGGGPLDSGWPTTGVFNRTVCLRDADRAGKRAFAIYTGRDGSGGAYRLVYTVDGHGRLRVSVVLAGPTGALHREGWECAVPEQPLVAAVALGVPGRIIPSPVDDRCRHLAR